MSSSEHYPGEERSGETGLKKPYEKPQILEVKVLEGRTGPCAITADNSACQGNVFTS